MIWKREEPIIEEHFLTDDMLRHVDDPKTGDGSHCRITEVVTFEHNVHLIIQLDGFP